MRRFSNPKKVLLENYKLLVFANSKNLILHYGLYDFFKVRITVKLHVIMILMNHKL